MKRHLKMVVLAVLIAATLRAEVSATQFWGYDITNKVLKGRLFTPESKFTFGNYIGSDTLGLILGRFVGDGNEMVFVNGNPNATNMALWHVGMMALSRDFADFCRTDKKSALDESVVQPAVLSLVKQLCSWPSAEARNEEVLATLWLSVMSYDAPEEEFLRWRDFFLSETNKDRPSATVVEGLLSTMLLNPYFLMRN